MTPRNSDEMYVCEHCGHPTAVADDICPSCGEPMTHAEAVKPTDADPNADLTDAEIAAGEEDGTTSLEALREKEDEDEPAYGSEYGNE